MATMANQERPKPSLNLPQPEFHPLMEGIEASTQFKVTDELAQLLQSLPDGAVSEQVLATMATQPSLGGDMLRVLGARHPNLTKLGERAAVVRPQGGLKEISVAGQFKRVGTDVVDMLQLAADKASGSAGIDSGHLLQALTAENMLAPHWDVVALEGKSPEGIVDNLARLLRLKKDYAPTQELKTVEIKYQDSFPDLLKSARQKRLAPMQVPKDWVVNALNSLISGDDMVVIPTGELESELLAYRLAYDLALSNDNFGINNLRFVSRNDLLQGGEKTIESLIGKSQNGVIVMPFIEESPLRRNLQRAAIRHQVTLIMYDKEELVNDQGIERLLLDNPTDEEMFEMFGPLRREYERQFGLKIDINGLREATRLARRFGGIINQGIRPVEGVDVLLRQAASAIRLTAASVPALRKITMVKNDGTIHDSDIRYALQKLTGVEVQPDDKEKFNNMEVYLNEGVIGQEEAVSAVSNAVRRTKAGLSDPKKPIGSFMFLGPSGVGKTELGKKLAEFLFDSADELITVNMSEFGDESSRTRLIGAPPGYVGYEQAGQLTEQVRRKPYSVVMFDEIEKAHPEVLVVLLQMMDEGKLTDAQGRVIDFRNTVIIMTGNVGSHHYEKYNELGRKKVEELVRNELKSHQKFRPEFLNRLSQIIVFNPLDEPGLEKIAQLQIRKKNKELAANGIGVVLSLSQTMTRKLATIASAEPMHGARPLLRALDTHIYQAVTNLILGNKLKRGNQVEFDFIDGEIVHRVVKQPPRKK